MLARSSIRVGSWPSGASLPAAVPGEMQLVFVLRGQLAVSPKDAMSSPRCTSFSPLRAGTGRIQWQPAPAANSPESVLRAEADCHLVLITLPAADLLELVGKGPEAASLRDLLAEPLTQILSLAWEDRAWLGALAAHDLPCRARDLWTRLRLAEWLLRLLLPQENQLPAGHDDRIRRAQAWIERHLDEPLDQDALARHLNCSTRTLRRWLREELDLAPAQWQRLLRLQRAATLLREGRGAAETGAEVGYPNAAHFSNLFKLHYQCPPSQYRQRISRAG